MTKGTAKQNKQYEEDKLQYEFIRSASLTVLLECGIETLPIDLNRVSDHYGISIYQNNAFPILNDKEEGSSFYIDNAWAIVYDESQRKARTRFTLAHELGHILLGHSQFSSRKNAGQATRPKEERDADQFAARLLAPACVLWGTQSYLAEDIAVLCNISKDFARYREKSFAHLLHQNKILKTELELEVYRNFLPFINEYNDKKITPSF